MSEPLTIWAPPPFEPPSVLHALLTQLPFLFVEGIYHFLLVLRGPAIDPHPSRPVTLVCISDTHDFTPSGKIPEGDILVHAGDLTNSGSAKDIQAQIDWLDSFPHKYKLAIAGNHDSYLDARSRSAEDKDADAKLDWKSVIYLQHESITLDFDDANAKLKSSTGSSSGVRRIKVHGAPQIPACGPDTFAFQYPRGSDAWSGLIPQDTELLITHTPPKYHADLPLQFLGCEHLLREIRRVRPRVHVCGHIHAGRGREDLWWDAAQEAWEKVCERADRSRGRLLAGFIDERQWFDGAKVLFHAVSGVLWQRVWGGDRRGTVLVNSAFVDYKGRPGGDVRVVEM